MRFSISPLNAVMLTLLARAAFGADFDLLIRNGRVIDGAGNAWFRADVGVRGGKIAAIGKLANKTADRVIDAHDRIVAPGFIDVHVHADRLPERRLDRAPEASAFLFDGVTTIINGNCGWSETDLPPFFRDIEKAKPGVNMASMIGHGSVRIDVMGNDNRAPTAAELERMQAIVDKAMRDGAVGFSTGLWYAPATFAKTDEVIALAKVAGPYGVVYSTHMRDEGVHILDSVKEAIRVAEESGLRLEVSHMKVGDKRNWGAAPKVLELLNAARARGVDASGDFYPYTAGSSTMQPMFPRWSLAGGEQAILERLASKDSRARIASEMEQDSEYRGGNDDFSEAVVASCPFDHSLEGKNIPQIAKLWKGSSTLRAQVETILELRAKGTQKGEVLMVYHRNGPEDLLTYMRWPQAAVASDTIYTPFGDQVPHPRNYGTNARVFGEFVSKQHVLTVEDAVRRMTSLPARTFQLRDRGMVREGMMADLLVFDAAKVSDVATFEKPHQYSRGFDWVIVNGVAVIEEGKRNAERPGHVLRRRQD